MRFPRSSGVLLHPTSLPGPFGIGDFGPAAYRWIDWVASAGCRYWQLLPLGVTGYGDSPYASFSSFAGNPGLVSPEMLAADNLADADDLARTGFGAGRVDYGRVIPWKLAMLDRAYALLAGTPGEEFTAFRQAEAPWLDDFALFMAIKEAEGGHPWWEWDEPLRHRDAQAIATARNELRAEIERHAFRQFVFARQWRALRAHAAAREVRIIGDLPLYVAHDSADVWVRPDLFAVDTATGRALLIAGVPPDMFSKNGQLWGNPLYRWEAHAAEGYEWWTTRLGAALTQVDVLRLDHFTGFAMYWEVAGDATTARHGRWVEGPGSEPFVAARSRLGDLPVIAEDLGPLNGPVEKLRIELGFPGMKLLQQAFGGKSRAQFLPENYTEDFVVYTGTHDNDTSLGHITSAKRRERRRALKYLHTDEEHFVGDLVRAAWVSVAGMAVVPMQDLLELGTEARMNTPATTEGNWQWRMTADDASPQLAERLRRLNEESGRLGG